VGESVRKSLWALDQARAESRLAYHRIFESSLYEPWIRALAGDWTWSAVKPAGI
jgi:hypothetical protein